MARNTKPGTLGAKRRTKRLIIVGSIFAAVLVFFGTLTALSYNSYFTVAALAVSGNASVSVGEVASAAQEVTAGSYAGIIPRSGVFFYPTSKLEALLKQRYMRLETVEVYRTGWSSVRIEVTERKPDMLACDANSCAFTDMSGFVYGPAPIFSGYPFVMWKVEQLALATTVSPYYGEVHSLIAGLKNRGLVPQLLQPGEAGDISVAFEEGFVLKVNLKQSAQTILKNFDTVLANGGESIRTDEHKFLIEYIDLRFGNKVFYKPKEAGEVI